MELFLILVPASYSSLLYITLMDKLQIKNFLLPSIRSYAVATENLGMQSVISGMRNAKDSVVEDSTEKRLKENTFWMKDPKTGNWIPETHFGEIDVADLRTKYLSRKEKF